MQKCIEHYKTIVKMHYFKKNYPFNTKANLKNLGTALFLGAQRIRKLFYHLNILMF